VPSDPASVLSPIVINTITMALIIQPGQSA
jgi:hypothetical protein